MLWIQPGILIAAMALHLGMLLATVLLIGLRRGARSVVSELRGVRKRRKKKLPGVIVQAGIAVGVILAVYFSCKGFRALLDPTDALMGCQAMKLLYYVALIFAFDPVMLLAFRIAEWIGKITKAYHFRLALKLQESFWGRFKVMCFLFIFSGSLFCGLYSLYSSARLARGIPSREEYTLSELYCLQRALRTRERRNTEWYRIPDIKVPGAVRGRFAFLGNRSG